MVLLIDLVSMTASYRAQSNREINQLVGTMVKTNPDLDVSQIVEALNSSNIALAQKEKKLSKNMATLLKILTPMRQQSFLRIL